MILKLASRRMALLGAMVGVLATGAIMIPATTAEAGWRGRGYYGGWHGGYYPGYYGYRGYNSGAAVAAGVAGLAAGAIIGSALTQPRYYAPPPVYYAPAPTYYATPGTYYAYPTARGLEPYDPSLPAPSGSYYSSAGVAPGSADWNAYCASKYRSFDPATGTFLGYDGKRHYCR